MIRLFYADLNLGTHEKFKSKTQSALAILYPLLLQWHKTLSEKEHSKNFLAGLYLLAGSVN